MHVTTAGEVMFVSTVEPLIQQRCAPCHVGSRFAFASLKNGDHAANYSTFFDQISLDAPLKSRLLLKAISDADPEGIPHAGGAVITRGDATWQTLQQWIDVEKSERCPTCGQASPRAFIAYVSEPSIFWALDRDPIRTDHGLRDRARIMLQPVNAATMQPQGEPIDFLGDSFCGVDGRCDFGNIAVNHAGTQMAFECRLSLEPVSNPLDVRWNICIAEIAEGGHAVDPRFLMPQSRRHTGQPWARSDPFGLVVNGQPLKGPYDQHFHVRHLTDKSPVFSADDNSVILASQGPEPRTGSTDYQTYHGYEALDHIIAVDLDDGELHTIYRNEGGTADQPFLLRNGNIVFHTWNLERMDRHLYTQSTADGMMEIPVFAGHLQGPNMWGKATQLSNGVLVGMTGRRRSSIENYVPFAMDHTLGIGLDSSLTAMRILDPTVYEQVIDFPTGYCEGRANPEGPSCVIDRFYAEPSYSPDGRALIAYTSQRTYVSQGEGMFLNYARQGVSTEEAVASMQQYVPRGLGIALMDHKGNVQPLLNPPDGVMYRYPAWVGQIQPQRVQRRVTDESQSSTEIHIADVPIWFSFRDQDGTRKVSTMQGLDNITSLRVLMKESSGNACLNDARPYRYAVNAGQYDHPTHLGMNNATGYTRLMVPSSEGGDGHGDIPLKADKSVKVRVPAGQLLLFQGVDGNGHVVRQHNRVFALPPGHSVDTSIKRGAYQSQCMACHGSIDDAAPYVPLSQSQNVPLVEMDFNTEAKAAAAVDLTSSNVMRQKMTYLHAMRPVLDAKCVSCHSGASPAGELSLESQYSATANYPAGRWASSSSLSFGDYKNFLPGDKRVAGYNYSLAWSYALREDENEYKQFPFYQDAMSRHAPLADLAPWDPGYQNLFAAEDNRWRYLGGFYNSNFGRSDRFGGLSSDAWLIEILTGRDLDPRTYTGIDHTQMLSDDEKRLFMGVLDVGFVYMTRCDDRTIPSGPNAGQPWGAPLATD